MAPEYGFKLRLPVAFGCEFFTSIQDLISISVASIYAVPGYTFGPLSLVLFTLIGLLLRP